MNNPAKITWPLLLAMEPDLGVLELDALILSRRTEFDWRAWEKIKRTLKRLVGDFAERPELAEREFWDIAHDHLLAVAEGGRS